MAKAKAKVKKDEEVVIKSDPVLDNLASYIIEIFIKEDVNAFVEADLLHDLLVYKLDTEAVPIMEKIVRRLGEELKASRTLDLKKRIGGITQQKRVQFRNIDQYNAMIAVFFQAVDEKAELVDFIDDEQSFENFMILCINDYREFWERFASQIVEERMALEHESKLYANRNRADAAWEDVPTYADYVAARLDALAASAKA
jgi:hypothetical protein